MSTASLCLQAQQRLEILNADITTYEKQGKLGEEVRRLVGNVRLKQDSTFMYCDSAYQYIKENKLDAMSHVRIEMPDPVILRADHIIYDGQTKIAELYDNITLTDTKTTLRTQRMTYYRLPRYAFYRNGGTITDGENKLYSDYGYYFTPNRHAEFHQNVRVTSRDYVLTCDSLHYEAPIKRAIFVAPTLIVSAKAQSTMYTERGYYASKEREVLLYQHPYYQDTTYKMVSDTIYYSDSLDHGWAHCNLTMVNKDTTLFLAGEKGLFRQRKPERLLTDNAYMVQRLGTDTLTLFADTLFSREDTVRRQVVAPLFTRSPADTVRFLGVRLERPLIAYRHARFTMGQLQGICDSLAYDRTDSTLRMFQDPVLWSDQNQITGDSMRFWLRNKAPDSMRVYRNAFIASRENQLDYNQVQGDQLFGKFKGSQLARVRVYGSAACIYFTKDGPKLTGVNRATSEELFMYLKNNKPQKVVFIQKPVGTYTPIYQAVFMPNHLERFTWRGDERPPFFLGPRAMLDTLPPPATDLSEAEYELRKARTAEALLKAKKTAPAPGTQASPSRPTQPGTTGKLFRPRGN